MSDVHAKPAGPTGDTPLLSGVNLYRDDHDPKVPPAEGDTPRTDPAPAMPPHDHSAQPPTKEQLEAGGYLHVATDKKGRVTGYQADTARTDPEPALVEHPVANPTESGTGQAPTNPPKRRRGWRRKG